MVSGATLGTATGITLHLAHSWQDATGPFGLAGALAGGALAFAAVRMDRGRTAGLASLPDQQSWPIHGAVYAIPLMAMMPAMLWLGVVMAVDARQMMPVFVAGALVVAIGWGLIRVWSDHRLVVGLMALARDDGAGARQALQTLAQHPLATKRARTIARENLGILFLTDGELSAAAHWFSKVEDSAAAAAGLAIAQAGLGQLEAAQHALERARNAPGARRAQAEIDAARVLLVWRSEGVAAGRGLAERLDNPAAGPLFRGLLAHLRGDGTVPQSALVRALTR